MGESSRRPLCDCCGLPLRTCVCSQLPDQGPVDTPALSVFILQDPREKRRHLKTGFLGPLVLRDVTVCTSRAFRKLDRFPGLQTVVEESRCRGQRGGVSQQGSPCAAEVETVLLFPSPHSVDFEDFVASRGHVQHWNVLVLDATWDQASSMLHQSVEHLGSHVVQHVHFSQGTLDHLYQDRVDMSYVRKPPKADALSTVETIFLAARIVGEDVAADGLLRVASFYAQLHVQFASERGSTVTQSSPPPSKRRKLESPS